MVCCYQVTKNDSWRYGFAIASSARSPCNFGPLTDFAISVFREMSVNIMLTPPCNGISSSTKFSLNSCSHSGISGSSHRLPRSIVVFFKKLFWNLVGLGFHRFSRSIINQFRHWHWRDVTIRCIFPFSNRHIAYCG